jgi:hypothetical protein
MNPTNAKFSPPSGNTDGSALTPGEIVKYTLSVGLKVAAGATQTYPSVFDDLDVAPAADGTISVPLADLGSLAFGDYVGHVVAVTAAGVQSAPSADASFSLVAPVVTPNPPTALAFV